MLKTKELADLANRTQDRRGHACRGSGRRSALRLLDGADTAGWVNAHMARYNGIDIDRSIRLVRSVAALPLAMRYGWLSRWSPWTRRSAWERVDDRVPHAACGPATANGSRTTRKNTCKPVVRLARDQKANYAMRCVRRCAGGWRPSHLIATRATLAAQLEKFLFRDVRPMAGEKIHDHSRSSARGAGRNRPSETAVRKVGAPPPETRPDLNFVVRDLQRAFLRIAGNPACAGTSSRGWACRSGNCPMT